MGQDKKQTEDHEAGAPEWMVTFSDCMTLLLTFFVLLLSFSSFDQLKFNALKVVFSESLPSVSRTTTRDKEAFLATERFGHELEVDKGSEKPTLARGSGDNLTENTGPSNFHDRKVFLISSDKIFCGRGTVILLQGRKVLSDMASFLKEIPDKVVVSENGQGDEKNSEHLGLQRAWAVIEYFTTKHNLDESLFSIAASTLQEDLESDEPIHSATKPGRMLEIVLLERSIYN